MNEVYTYYWDYAEEWPAGSRVIAADAGLTARLYESDAPEAPLVGKIVTLQLDPMDAVLLGSDHPEEPAVISSSDLFGRVIGKIMGRHRSFELRDNDRI